MKKSNTIKGIVYKVEHKETGQVYIGATSDSLHQRKLDHQERAMRGENTKLATAIATYGPDAFQWTVTDTAQTRDELAIKEKEHIANNNSFEKGYNSSSGGEFKKTVYQYSKLDGRLIKSFDCLKSAANAVNSTKSCISDACIGNNNSCKGYYWSYEKKPFFKVQDNRKKSVIQISSSSGQAVATYQSVALASKATGLSKTSISRVCRNERKQAGGFFWKYET